MPVTGFYSVLDVLLRFAHAFLDAVVDTRRISDNQGRSIVCLRFSDGFHELCLISTHADLCYIYITVGHRHHAKVFLLDSLTGSRKFCNRCRRRRLGSLPAGVGVNFGVEYQHVDIFAGSQYVVQTAVADVVSPAVSADCPDGFLYQIILVSEDSVAKLLQHFVSGAHAAYCVQNLPAGCNGFFAVVFIL